jgi:diguanylate cyclase (GGDEF)-like protein
MQDVADQGQVAQAESAAIQSRVRWLTTAIAGVCAIIVGLGPPAAAFIFGLMELRYSSFVEVNAAAVRAQEVLSREGWTVDDLSDGLADPHHEMVGHNYDDELKRVLDATGQEVARRGVVPHKWLSVFESAEIVIDGVRWGSIEIYHGLRDLIAQAVLVFAFSATVALLAFVFLRTVPLRLMGRAMKQASTIARSDVLTGLPNRAQFAILIAEAAGRGRPGAVMLVDLDRFKAVNDTLGHAAGDDVIRTVAARLLRQAGPKAHVARLGGDEFAVLLSPAPPTEELMDVAGRICAVVAMPILREEQEIRIGATVGIATSSAPNSPIDQLLYQADLALYAAKNDRRGTARLFDPSLDQENRARVQIEAALRRAIGTDALTVHYQPQLDLQSNRLKGVEALLRFTDPDLGPIPPDKFIPIAEETGLILALGRWVLKRACQDAMAWDGLSVAVNISPAQFRTGDLVRVVSDALKESGLPGTRLELEITEGIFLENTAAVIETLQDLRHLGVRIAMDDFGTGYSSLAYLRRFPFDKIKIDRSFINEIGQSAEADSIVNAVLAIGQSLDIVSNAEGVENAEQAALLASRGCREVQGYLYSRPLPREEFERRWLERAGRDAA